MSKSDHGWLPEENSSNPSLFMIFLKQSRVLRYASLALVDEFRCNCLVYNLACCAEEHDDSSDKHPSLNYIQWVPNFFSIGSIRI